MRPLYDKSLSQNKVTCLDVYPGMQYLVAGYKSGAVALWDLKTYKLEKLMPDVHETEVTGAKIYHITD